MSKLKFSEEELRIIETALFLVIRPHKGNPHYLLFNEEERRKIQAVRGRLSKELYSRQEEHWRLMG